MLDTLNSSHQYSFSSNFISIFFLVYCTIIYFQCKINKYYCYCYYYYSCWTATPITEEEFHWYSPQHESFITLKERLTTAPILACPDFYIPFALYTDASGDSIGFDLTQVQHGWGRVIVYGGRNFSDTEKKYSATEQEALPVVVAIQKCRPSLLGNHFTVVVDHRVLKLLMSLRSPTGRLAQWVLTLQVYDFAI